MNAIAVVSIFLPLVGALALVYPLGHTWQEDLVLGIVGGVGGYLLSLAVDMLRGAVRLHEGSVCLGGQHISPTFMFFLGLPSAVAAMCGAFVFEAFPPTWGIVPAVMVYVLAYVAANMGWRQASMRIWPDDWDTFIHATTGGDDRVQAANRMIEGLFHTGSGATTVREFELLVIQALVFRGFALGLPDADAVGEVFEELALEGDERDAWLCRELDENVWQEIAPVYGHFVHEVRRLQGQQLDRKAHGEASA